MTNTILQEKLSFLALSGTQDVMPVNKLFFDRRRRKKVTPKVLLKKSVDEDALTINDVQLSLF